MEAGYGVIWREGEIEQVGRLTLTHDAIRLTSFEKAAPPMREVALDEIVASELRCIPSDDRRMAIVLTLSDGSRLEIESAAAPWILSSMIETVLGHLAGDLPERRQALIALKLRPDRLEEARQLLRGGPPFDPTDTTLVFHSVFLLDDEALFLFETNADDDIDPFFDLDAWEAVAAWRELATGEVRLAEQPYSWTRGSAARAHAVHVGLGF